MGELIPFSQSRFHHQAPENTQQEYMAFQKEMSNAMHTVQPITHEPETTQEELMQLKHELNNSNIHQFQLPSSQTQHRQQPQNPSFNSSNAVSLAQKQLRIYNNIQDTHQMQCNQPRKRMSEEQATIRQLRESLRKSQEKNRAMKRKLEDQALFYRDRENDYEEKINVLENNFRFDHNNGNFCNPGRGRY